MKKLISFITALTLSLMLSVTVAAEATADNGCYIVSTGETDAVLYDIADELTPDEEEFAKNMLVLTSINSQTNVGVFIIDEAADDDPLFQAEDYANILFNEFFGSDNHGILLLINSRTYYNWIALNGEIFGYGDPAFVNQYLENMSEDLINGNYADAINIFCESIMETSTEFYSQNNKPADSPAETTVSEADVPESTNPLSEKYDLSRCIWGQGIYTIPVNSHTALLHDIDNTLTPEEEEVVITRIVETVEDVDFSVAVLITDDIGEDKSDYAVMDFADVYYENYCGMNTDGILLFLNNDTKYDWISTSGRCIDAFDRYIDPIFDSIWDNIQDGNFPSAICGFCNSVTYFNANPIEYNSSYDYDDYDDGFSVDLEMALSSLMIMGIFILIGLLIFGSIIKNNYSLKKNMSVADYVLKDSLALTQKTDTYLRTYTTRTRVNSSSSGGHRSGSRSHRSSGGGRHGGGGRRR